MLFRLGIIDRYLLRETTAGWVAVTLVLMLLMMGSGFARFLGRAAAGKLPQEMVLKLVALSSIEYLVVILPVSLLLGIMLALGRLYRDNEMAAISTAGFGLQRMYRPFVPLLLTVTVVTGWLSFDLSPWASGEVNQLRSQGRQEAVRLQAFAEGEFRNILDGQGVFYTEKFDRSEGVFENVFVRIFTEDTPVVILARSGTQTVDPDTRSRSLVLYDGYRYEGRAGEADYRITAFGEHGIRVTPPPLDARENISAMTTMELLSSSKLEDRVELHARLSAAVMVLLLGLLAVPLSQTRPRQGRYGRLVLALVIYLLYSNLLSIGRVTAEEGELSIGVGLWSIHAAVFAYVCWLLGQREGWWRRPRRIRASAEAPA